MAGSSRSWLVAPSSDSVQHSLDLRDGRSHDSYLYERFGTTATDEVESAWNVVDGCAWSIFTVSGMTAIDVAVTTALMCRASRPAGVLLDSGSYSGTRSYARHVLNEIRGIPVVAFPFPETDSDDDEWNTFRDMVHSMQPTVMLVESISNPFLGIADLRRLRSITDDVDAVLVVDSTLSPLSRAGPLSQGADMVVHSATKYITGTNDCLSGVVAGNERAYRDVARGYVRRVGVGLPSPDCEYVCSQFASLPQRFARQCENALTAAAMLKDADVIDSVWSLSNDSDLCTGLVTFELKLGRRLPTEAVQRFIDATGGVIKHSVSFGSTTTTLTFVAVLDPALSHRAILRLSCGTEDRDDLRHSLTAAVAGYRNDFM